MADQKITDLTALTGADAADVLAIVDDPAGTPETKKITVQDLCQDLEWGEIYADEGTGSQALSATTWTAINQFELAGNAQIVTIPSLPQSLTLTNAGFYEVSYHVSFEMTSTGTGVQFDFRPYWNSTGQVQGRSSVDVDQNTRATVARTCIVDATSGGASLELYVYAASAETFVVRDMGLYARRIGNT